MRNKTIVITGGGTGGHIYPGLAIAQEIQNKYPDYQIHFVGAKGGMEEKILPKYSYPYHLIKVGRFHQSVGKWQQIKTLLMMPLSFLQAVSIFLKVRPRIVLGVGGFASGPFLFISYLLGAKTAIWEANAHPGLANRVLSRFVNLNFLVFPEAEKWLNANDAIVTGMPVRKEFFNVQVTQAPSPQLRVLVFGGSQGARAINDAVVEMVTKHPEVLNSIQLRHQTGSRDFERIQQAYGAELQNITLMEYIHNMPEELAAADLVICRSGASTVAEVMTCAKPAIFIPLPTAADDHQSKNAQAVANKNAAILLRQGTFDAQHLRTLLMDLQQNRGRLAEMSRQLKHFDFSNADQKIVQNLFEGVL